MSRKYWLPFLVCTIYVTCVDSGLADVLPTGSTPPAIAFKHFPDRLHAFVWRNWEMIAMERMAEVAQTTPEKIRQMGESMGLPAHVPPPPEYPQRGYISIIRRNWHLLPYEQLLTLLGWDAEKLAFALREDDFLWIKLGSLKPKCSVLRYIDPNESVTNRCREIKAIVSSHFGTELAKPATPRFDFIRQMSAQLKPGRPQVPDAKREEPIRFLYSYFGVFGDPLLNPQLDPYPDSLLQQLSDRGVNGVWLHVVLRQLAPSDIFPEFGASHEMRLANLAKMVDRAGRYGVKIYLYMNEPRAMPGSFFEGRENLRGVQEGDHFTMCTSAPQVRQWVTDSLEHVFERVPGLGGVFTITGSENLTNCYSHSRNPATCPRCSKRSGPEVIAEINTAIAKGVWAGNSSARVIVWDWGWPDGTPSGWGSPDWVSQIIEALPDNVYLMSVSEWSKPVARGGIPGAIGEYSISTVGPGPRSVRHWALAKKRGLRTIAKVQVNACWELSAVPYLPVMNLIAQHCENLNKADVDGLMLSWTVGGYPSPNLELVREFQQQPAPTIRQALTTVARNRYGKEAADDVLDAWSKFGTAFTEYPFDGRFLYRGPAQCGPANLLYAEPTGYASTMVGFPYDDLNGWRGIYPAEVLAQQFEKVTAGWQNGLSDCEKALAKASSAQLANVQGDLTIARAAALHFDSVASQVRFILARDELLSGSLSQSDRQARLAEIKKIVDREIEDAKLLFDLTRLDSRIGFEASNHYYYLPLDLVEKVINCEYVTKALSAQ